MERSAGWKQAAPGRHRIGVLLPELDGEFYRPLVDGLCRAASQQNVTLVFYPGHLPGTPIVFARQLGAAYELVHADAVDGLLIFSATLQYHLSDAGVAAFIKRFSSLPLVCVGHAFSGAPAVLLDSYSGFRELVSHFIEAHGHRRIALIEGPPQNRDAAERLRAYLDAHQAAGLPIDPALRKVAHFQEALAKRAIAELWRDGVDFSAVLCANDEMAHGVMAAAVERGLRVPEDLAVGGFDDLRSMRQMGPSLSTVNQAIDRQGELALGLLLERLQGQATATVTQVPTRLVLRRSCGCMGGDTRIGIEHTASDAIGAFVAGIDAPAAFAHRMPAVVARLQHALVSADGGAPFDAALSQLIQAWLAHAHDLTSLQRMILGMRSLVPQHLSAAQTAHVAGRLLQGQARLMDTLDLSKNQMEVSRRSTAMDFRIEFKTRVANDQLGGLLGSLVESLRNLGVPNCWVSLYERPLTIEQMKEEGVPRSSRVILATCNGVSQPTWAGKAFNTGRLWPDAAASDGEPAAQVVLPLFHLASHFGFAVIGRPSSPENAIPYEELRHELSSHIHHCLLVRELAEAQDLLRADLAQATEHNVVLAHLAMRDTLTGLLNRRGFFERAEAFLAMAKSTGDPLTAIYIDLDGLKPINDVYGHEQGDVAIRQAGLIIHDVFRHSDVVGRIGGDEFAVLTHLTNGEVFGARMRDAFDRHNATSNSPYKLSVSIGSCMILPTSNESLEKVLAEADRELYAQKRRNRMALE